MKPHQENISPCKFTFIIIDISFIPLLLITCKPPCPDPPTTVTIHHTKLIWRLFPLLQSLKSASHVTPHVSHTTASLHNGSGPSNPKPVQMIYSAISVYISGLLQQHKASC
ncbi:hypothetical protein DY000_02054452 [Brassica cretica]|uniref:Uncharacterized protein n=1 Tax=Brassica cretica TaxID=69181 RepID=A0ABQ7AJY8_BRACR|nr:hypothetical protein DY000_02054452 [Brassica cretica]